MDDEEMRQHVEDYLEQAREHHESAHVLDLTDEAHLPPGTPIRIASDDGHWLRIEIVENSTGRVRLTSGEFTTPVDARIMGSMNVSGPLPHSCTDASGRTTTVLDGNRLMVPLDVNEVLPLQVRHWHVLFYEVAGAVHVLNGACAVWIILPSGQQFDLWEEPKTLPPNTT
jgi:hypothetical protein